MVVYDVVLVLKGGVLSFGEMTSHLKEKSLPTFWFKIRLRLDIARCHAITRDVISGDQISTGSYFSIQTEVLSLSNETVDYTWFSCQSVKIVFGMVVDSMVVVVKFQF